MRLFDTRRAETAELLPDASVRLYVCGITPYDSTHLGHAFTYIVFDALVRVLEHAGHEVRYVRNVTDVDDDILRKARELEVPFDELARREVARFERDLSALNLRPPDVVPLATETVPAIVEAVEDLVARGHAYALDDGRVYFDTCDGQAYGRLSDLDRDELERQFAEKGGDPDAAGKRSALDFLLWQPSAADEPRWDSPWGAGRPGWHIECSVMAMEHLGPTIDVHGGGNDLVFPHHEAEILQAESLTGQSPFAGFWMHVGMVALDGVKMSKSLGNLVFVSDLVERFEAGAVRRYLLSHHYREGWSYADGELEDAAAAYKRWRAAAAGDGRRNDLAPRFFAALHDDLDTPRALAVLDDAAAADAGATLRDLAAVLGFDLT
jgi:L-cysteine:1D-myo-inositol 2-amino-2-deoxy-alpha-D-glucopyranoside ligase